MRERRIPNVVIIETEDGENYCHIQGDVTDFEIDSVGRLTGINVDVTLR